MEIGNWSATPDLNDIYREIRALGLESNLAELEAYGFTIVEGALTPALTKDLRDAIIAIADAITLPRRHTSVMSARFRSY